MRLHAGCETLSAFNDWIRRGIMPGPKDLHFHDLRGTAVTRLALSNCSVPEIAAITGHSMKTVQEILDAHYLGGRVELAESAIKKLSQVYG
jgi:integrase